MELWTRNKAGFDCDEVDRWQRNYREASHNTWLNKQCMSSPPMVPAVSIFLMSLHPYGQGRHCICSAQWQEGFTCTESMAWNGLVNKKRETPNKWVTLLFHPIHPAIHFFQGHMRSLSQSLQSYSKVRGGITWKRPLQSHKKSLISIWTVWWISTIHIVP